jgi:hypothetical protein
MSDAALVETAPIVYEGFSGFTRPSILRRLFDSMITKTSTCALVDSTFSPNCC